MSVKDKSIYELPTGDLKEELENIIAPDFFFTQESIYDCLFDIFSYLDAVPRLDENNELTITYLNDYSEEKEITNKFVGYNSKLSVDRYTNGLLTYYQNARIDNTCFTPNSKNFKRVSSTKVGVMGEANEYKIITDNPIDYVKHLYLHFNDDAKTISCLYKTSTSISATGEFTYTYRIIDDTIFDFADACLTDEVWSALDAPEMGSSYGFENQLNRMHYKQGSKEINFMIQTSNGIFTANSIYSLLVNQCSTFLGVQLNEPEGKYSGLEQCGYQKTPNPYDIYFQVEYKPQVKGIAKVENPQNKSLGEELISQQNGGALLSKMGKNSLGQSIISGNPSRNVSVQVSSFDKRFKVGDYYTDENNDKRIINKATSTIYNDFTIQTLELTKNFNKLSQFIRQDKQKRFSEISSSLVEKSEDFYTDYIYFSSVEDEDLITNDIHLSNQFIKQSLINTFGIKSNSDCDLDLIALIPYVDDTNVFDNDLKVITNTIIEDEDYYLSVPFYKYGYGNTINYEMGFEDSVSGGTILKNYNYDWFSQKYKTSYSQYCDNYGFADSFFITFRSSTNWDKKNYNNIPYMTKSLVESNYWCGGFDKLKYYKKPNEIFGLNYQVCFLGIDATKDFLGDYFVKYSSFITGKNMDKLTIYVNGNYSILDMKASGERLSDILYANVTTLDSGVICVYLGVGATKDYSSWCVCDSNKNVVMAFNRPISKGSNFKIYFYSNKNRVK